MMFERRGSEEMYGGWRIWNSGAILKIKILAWCLLSAESKGFLIFTRVSAALSGRCAVEKLAEHAETCTASLLKILSICREMEKEEGGGEKGRKGERMLCLTRHMYLYRIYAYVNSWKAYTVEFGVKDNIYWSLRAYKNWSRIRYENIFSLINTVSLSTNQLNVDIVRNDIQ